MREKAWTEIEVATQSEMAYYEENMFRNDLWDKEPHLLAGFETFLLLRLSTMHFTTVKGHEIGRFKGGDWVHLVDAKGRLM